jgi:signal transduction histidine kinase
VIWAWTIGVGLALAALPFAVWLNVLAGVPLLSHASGLQPDAVFVASYAVVGLFITHRVHGNRLGPLLCLIAILQAAAGLATAYAAYGIGVRVGGLSYDDVLFKLSGPLFVASFMSFTVWLPLWFPTGKVAARPFTLVGSLGVGAIVAISAGMVRLRGWPAMAFFTGEPLPAFASTMFRISDDLQQILPWFALATLAYRYRLSDRTERRQLRWFIIAAVSIAITVADAIGSVPSWLDGVRQIPWIPVAIAVAIWHDGLYDLNLLIRRSVVYGVLLAMILAVYVAVVELAAVAFNARGIAPSLIATALVALAVQPTRIRLERHAERIVYGGRRDPRRALVHMGERLRSSNADDMLLVLCGAVVEGARVPGAAIVLPSGAQAQAGTVEFVVEEFPLVHTGVPVGRLRVAAHPGERSLDRAARTVVTTILPVASAAVHAWSLADEVTQSRQRLVSAREEERRRLRRDLHDGLGPALAGIALEIQAAQSLLDVDRAAAVQMLQAAEGWARDAISEIRRVVYGLRPPALDQLGLVRAIEEHAAALDTLPLRISISADGPFRSLPAATEVAAYLITLEALTNVVHHAKATTCRIALTVTCDEVELEIVDNGQGIAAGAHHGVGLSSMRERAEELGGSVVVSPAAPGTRVGARIPLGIR